MQEFMKIMIAYDGSSRAEAALRDLQYAGLPRHAEAKLVSVVEPLITTGPPEAAFSAPVIRLAQNEGQQAKMNVWQGAARLHKTFPAWALDTAVLWGNAALQIVTEAENWNPEMIVISPLNRSKFERVLFGSFSRSVVDKAPCTVRVAREVADEEASGLRLMIGYDGSQGAEAAVCEVALRQWPPNTEVRLVAAMELGSLDNIVESAINRQPAASLFENAEQLLRQAGLRVSTSIREGRPKRVLLDEAEEWAAHCIFVGRNRHNTFSRIFTNSTSAAIASQAPCSVEVVRQEQQRRWTRAPAVTHAQFSPSAVGAKEH